MKKILYKKNFSIKNNSIILCPIGDIHFGSSNCNENRFEEALDWIYKTKNAYVIGMGDYLECATRNSIGSGVYEQKEIVQEQLEKMIEYLKPIAKEGRLLGLLDGNHENRVYKETGLNVTKIMCQILNVDYLGWGVNMRLRVGEQIYKVFATHGSSGGKYISTKLNPLMKFADVYDSEIFCMGHVHDLAHVVKPYFIQDSKHMYMKEINKHFILTGAFLDFWDGYAEQKQLTPSRQGYSKIKLYSLKHLIEVKLE